jgi:hypothetical protein
LLHVAATPAKKYLMVRKLAASGSATNLKKVLDAHMAQRAHASEKEIGQRESESQQAQWGADCRELEGLYDELRQLSPLIKVQHEAAANQFNLEVSMLEFRPGCRARTSFESSISLRTAQYERLHHRRANGECKRRRQMRKIVRVGWI